MSTDGSRKVIGGFRVLKDLKAGAGSQGTVYKAVCEVSRFPSVSAGDVVALKVMAVQDDDGEAYAKLERRTAKLVALDHPNIVKYHGCFCEKGPFNDVHVIVLEFVEGRSLKELLSESPCGLGADEAMRIAYGLVDGLSYTSVRGIVHRDIKPANVIVRPDGTPKLIDFEVAHRVEGTATVGGSNMIGTFDYMAPDFTDDSFRGDVRSDIFSMGVCLHEMLTGRTPYRRQSATSTQANVAFLQRWLKAGTSANPLRISSHVGKLLPGARELLERALSPDRSNRIADFPAFHKTLSRIHYRELSHAGRRWRLLKYIGHGGFGEVFGAVDMGTGKRVAIKHLLNEVGLDRFRREAATMRRVSDAGFPHFIDFFMSESGEAFLVMDYLDGMPGQSLKDVLHANHHHGLDFKTVLTAFTRYAHTLASIHSIGVIHRDIKPANLYFPVASPESAVIMDLGIARDLSGTATVGDVPGTIDYMPPECVSGQTRGGPEADVWALGLCLYEALSGKLAYPRLPDGAAAFQAYFARVKKGQQPDFSGVDDKPELRNLLEQMCTLDPARRLRNIRLVERALRIANGENPADLPLPDADFVWKEDDEYDDTEPFLDVTQATVCAGNIAADSDETRETVWCDNRALDSMRSKLVGNQPEKKSKATFFILVSAAILLVAGGAVWKYSEQRKAAEIAAIEKRARLAAEAEEERRKAEAKARRMAEEKARKAEAEAAAKRKAEEIAAAKRKAEEIAAAKRKAEEEAAAAKLKDEEEKRKAEEEAEAKRKAEEEKRKAEAEAAAKLKAQKLKLEEDAKRKESEEAEAKRKAEEAKRKAEEAKRKAEEDAAAKRISEEKKHLAEAEAKRKAEAEAARRTELKQIDDAWKAYKQAYNKRLDEALKPGSRIDPRPLQQEYLLKRRAYMESRKKLEQEKPRGTSHN